jgi:methylphosphotriester-DNA--protein-cysteine methyltransferase
MRPVETIQEWGIKENDWEVGVNSTKIYCKNFCNVTMYPQNNNIINK